MRKLILPISLVALFFGSCKKDDATSTTTSSLASTATITGTVRANTDAQTPESEKRSGAKILARYNKEDLVLNPVSGVTYPDVVISATTDANGRYTFTIPTGGQTVFVEIIPQDFEEDVITSPTTSTPDQLFSTGSQFIGISEQEYKIIDINY